MPRRELLSPKELSNLTSGLSQLNQILVAAEKHLNSNDIHGALMLAIAERSISSPRAIKLIQDNANLIAQLDNNDEIIRHRNLFLEKYKILYPDATNISFAEAVEKLVPELLVLIRNQNDEKKSRRKEQ